MNQYSYIEPPDADLYHRAVLPEGTFCGDDVPLPPGTFHGDHIPLPEEEVVNPPLVRAGA